MSSVEITVNGKTATAEVEDRTLLVEMLREKLGLTGTHVGCDTSQCGACLVLMDGVAVKSCTVLAVRAAGTRVTTIEGLATGNNLHPMQQAFHEHHGLQCGFCTPGMIVASTALIERVGGPVDRDDVVEALGGHYCRCTGYVKIIDAVMAASRGDVGHVDDVPAPQEGEPDVAVKGSPA